MRTGLVVRRAVTIPDAMLMRDARNSCREFMTRNQSHIDYGQQLLWWKIKKDSIIPFVVDLNEGLGIGYGLIQLDKFRAWLTAGLHPEVRGQGLGTEVFRFLTQEAERLERIPALEVLSSNAPAMAVYRKLGFVERHAKGSVITMEKLQ